MNFDEDTDSEGGDAPYGGDTDSGGDTEDELERYLNVYNCTFSVLCLCYLQICMYTYH